MQLSGITVVEITENIAGPQAGQILADLGARVIKIENPATGGDSTRRIGGPPQYGASSMFHMQNRNKRSLALDLKNLTEVARLKRFILEKADVVLQNLRVGAIDRLGLGAKELRGAKPALVFCSLGAFTRGGPNERKGGYDILMQGYCGLLSLTGEADRPPSRIGVSAIDTMTGVWSALAVIAALFERARTGEGATIDTSLYEVAMSMIANPYGQYRATGEVPLRAGGRLPGTVPLQPFAAEDGLIVIACANNRLFAKLTEALGHPEWRTDPRFVEPSDRDRNADALQTLIEQVLRGKPCEYWIVTLDKVGIPCGPVHDLAQVAVDPETRSSGIVGTAPGRPDLELILAPVSFGGHRPPVNSGAPTLGEFNAEFDRLMSR
jgi:crotonobetainyl-CoA:carnitine CoA-transferase CaiB-like acyl-CoA transferase